MTPQMKSENLKGSKVNVIAIWYQIRTHDNNKEACVDRQRELHMPCHHFPPSVLNCFPSNVKQQGFIDNEVHHCEAGQPVDLVWTQAILFCGTLIANLPDRPIAQAEQKATFSINPKQHRTTLPKKHLQLDLLSSTQRKGTCQVDCFRKDPAAGGVATNTMLPE